MILSSCHHYSLNNDCHCHCHYMQRIYVYFILSSILFYWIRFTVLFSIVSHINEWFVSVCPSVRLSVCVFICMNKFMFSVFSCFFILSLLFLFSFHFHFSFFTLFLWTSSSHTHTDTDTQINMNICSFLWLVHITSKGCKWRIVFEW